MKALFKTGGLFAALLIASGTFIVPGDAAGQTARNLVCGGCVGKRDIGKNAVGNRELRKAVLHVSGYLRLDDSSTSNIRCTITEDTVVAQPRIRVSGDNTAIRRVPQAGVHVLPAEKGTNTYNPVCTLSAGASPDTVAAAGAGSDDG